MCYGYTILKPNWSKIENKNGNQIHRRTKSRKPVPAPTLDEVFKTNHENKVDCKTIRYLQSAPGEFGLSIEGTVNDISESSGVGALGSQDLQQHFSIFNPVLQRWASTLNIYRGGTSSYKILYDFIYVQVLFQGLTYDSSHFARIQFMWGVKGWSFSPYFQLSLIWS
jgi:hypothetical protein